MGLDKVFLIFFNLPLQLWVFTGLCPFFRFLCRFDRHVCFHRYFGVASIGSSILFLKLTFRMANDHAFILSCMPSYYLWLLHVYVANILNYLEWLKLASQWFVLLFDIYGFWERIVLVGSFEVISGFCFNHWFSHLLRGIFIIVRVLSKLIVVLLKFRPSISLLTRWVV